MDSESLIGPHGAYRELHAFQVSEIIYVFCRRFVDVRTRTVDQMVQAARSGRRNIAEGSVASATSRKMEMKLTAIARASLEELLLDHEDYLRQNGLQKWEKEHPKAVFIRKLGKREDRTYQTYRPISRKRRLRRRRTLLSA